MSKHLRQMPENTGSYGSMTVAQKHEKWPCRMHTIWI